MKSKDLLARLRQPSKDRPLLVVDVRSPREYKSFHIEGAVSMPIYHLREKLPVLMAMLNEIGRGRSPTEVAVEYGVGNIDFGNEEEGDTDDATGDGEGGEAPACKMGACAIKPKKESGGEGTAGACTSDNDACEGGSCVKSSCSLPAHPAVSSEAENVATEAIPALTPEAKNVDVVCVCLSAHRSPPAVRLLRQHGAEGARQLSYGMAAWRLHGYPIVSGPLPLGK